jgi:hypothetical protein
MDSSGYLVRKKEDLKKPPVPLGIKTAFRSVAPVDGRRI